MFGSQSQSRLAGDIRQHYTRPDLGTLIEAALRSAGKDLARLTPADLAPIDEFHIRGRAATLELARDASMRSDLQVLDIGSGIGGSCRCLAHEFGCRVTGVDLNEEYCQVATMLSSRVGLAHLVDHRLGDATHLSFAENSFDVVWTEHAAMNIPNKSRLYREMHRVLRPGGTLALYDVFAGSGAPVYLPVPWARSADTSFLVSQAELRRLLRQAGFMIVECVDTTDAAQEWVVAMADENRGKGPPALGWHVLLWPDFPIMAYNQRRNLEEGRITVAKMLARKAAPV